MCIKFHTLCTITHCVSNYTLCVKLHTVCQITHCEITLEDLLWILLSLTFKKFPSLEKIFHKRRLRRLWLIWGMGQFWIIKISRIFEDFKFPVYHIWPVLNFNYFQNTFNLTEANVEFEQFQWYFIIYYFQFTLFDRVLDFKISRIFDHF